MELIQSKESLSIIEVKAFFELATVYPDVPVSQKVINVVLGSLKNFLDDYGDLLSISFSLVENTAISFGNFLYKVATKAGPVGKNSFVMMNDITSKYIISAHKLASKFKIAGGILAFVSCGLGIWDDVENNGKTNGQAVAHNVVSTGIGFLTTVAISFSPLGGAVIVGVAGGIGVQWVFENLYDSNFLGIQDALDSFGNWMDDVGSNVENSLIDFGEKLGECTSQLFDFVNPFS